MDWKEVTVKINQTAADAAANIMEEIGAQGVVWQEEDEGKRVTITAYYPDDPTFTGLLTLLEERTNSLNDFGLSPGKVEMIVKSTRDEDWATSWHKFFKPTPAGEKFIICPSWEDCSAEMREVIQIDPGMAFGIGGHETTRMCIQLLEKYADQQIDKMLDVGSGTGILTIVAARLGVQDILGIDIDPAAVNAARTNIAINGVADRVRIEKSDLLTDVEDSYQLITANLLPDIILRLLPSIPPFLASSGIFILSGIINTRKDTIINSLEELDLQVIEELADGEWVSLVARKG